MLSATSTIADMKARLRNGYAYYDFASDEAFSSTLTINVQDTELIDLVPVIGRSEYDRIAALDKIGLSETESHIYWAEVYFAIARFLREADAVKIQSITGGSYSRSIGGVSESISGGTSVSGYRAAAGRYYRTALSYMSLAGHTVNQLRRCGTPTIEESNNIGY